MEQLLQEIKKRYGLRLEILEKVKKGFLSENHILTDGTTWYFLKKYRFDNKKRIEEVHAAKQYFNENGISVILPLKNDGGDTFFFCEGGYYALFPFVQGRQPERGKFSDTAVVSLGKTLGLIHRAGSTSTLLIDDQFKPWNKEECLKTVDVLLEKIEETGVDTLFDRLSLATVFLKKDLIEKNEVTYTDLGFKEDHLLHGDYIDHNVFFDDNDTVSYVFDFEKTGYCARSYELFRSMTYSFWDESKGALDVQASQCYFNAYNSVYPMEPEEVRKGLRLFYLKSIHGGWVESEHYLKGNDRVDHFLLPGFQRTIYLSKHVDLLADILIRGV